MKVIFRVLMVGVLATSSACFNNNDGGGTNTNTTSFDNSDVSDTVVQVVNDLDDSLTTGLLASNVPAKFKRHESWASSIYSAFIPNASAEACFFQPFDSCGASADNQRSRTFASCSIGSFTLNGSASLTFSESDCRLDETGDTVTRTFDWSAQGPLGGTLTGTSSNVEDYRGSTIEEGGQTITRTSDGYTYAVDGLNRTYTGPLGVERINYSVVTTSPLVVEGTSRLNRAVTSGEMVIIMNKAQDTITLTPDAVTWDGDCTCPTSGTINGVLGSDSSELTITFTDTCGRITFLYNGSTATIDSGACNEV